MNYRRFCFPSRSIDADSIAPRRTISVIRLSSGLAAAGCALVAIPAHATTTTINFTGSTPYILGYYYGLTNSLTGTGVLPALAVQAGDIIQGTVSFAYDINVPNNSYFTSQVNINDTDGVNTDYINYTATLRYYDGSIDVTPVGLGTYGGSNQGLGIGNYSSTGTQGFTFDKIQYAVTINYFFDQENQIELNQGTLPESNSSFRLFAVGVTSVPEPATWAMMIAGFGVVGMMLRSRRRVRVSFA